MSRVVFHGVVKRYGSLTALNRLDLEAREGEFLTLLGPSGCGKTTALRLVAGFLRPDAGTITIDGEDVTDLPPHARSIGMVFQDYALFPHLTVKENIAYGLRERRVPQPEIDNRVHELLEMVRLDNVAARYPAQLSGGQQQRVAIARAVAYTPRVLLMDEPLGALDLKLREAMQTELRRIQQELAITTIYVTHDQFEAMFMSDSITVMNQGCIEQIGTPQAIYEHPSTRFVAEFVGKINVLPARILDRCEQWLTVDVRGMRLKAPMPDDDVNGSETTVAVRPEHLRVLEPGAQADGLNVLHGVLETQSYGGNLLFMTVRVDDDLRLTAEVRPSDAPVVLGAPVQLAWTPEHSLVLEE